MARRGFTPGGGSPRSSQVQRPEADGRVVYYQRSYPLRASFLRSAQQRSCAFAWLQVHAIGRKFCAVKLLTRKTAVPRITPVWDLDLIRFWIPPRGLAGAIRLFIVCSGPPGSRFTARLAAEIAAL
jgi:hypothetical protein